ncbi:hypothetical protein CCP4SC76_1070006 [Gammaproteobacteria bacterium]
MGQLLALVVVVFFGGCFMSGLSGFFSVPARFNGRVVCRASARGSVWAWRAPSQGHQPSPACVFVPAANREQAQALAARASLAGFVTEIKPGVLCAVYGPSSPIAGQAPVWAVKVRLPLGCTLAQARSLWAKGGR